MSSPQTFEAGTTRHPAESASRAFSTGYSTANDSMARTGNLRHRPTTPPGANSTEDTRQLIEDHTESSTWYQTDMMVPPVDDIGVQVDLKPLIQARLEATGEEVQRIDFIVALILWILPSKFRHLQQPEPIVGEPSADYPAAVEEHGIKGQSIYTALFDHHDMETFTCKICPHIVQDNLEDAIAHQRSDHFSHYPYRCPAPHAKW